MCKTTSKIRTEGEALMSRFQKALCLLLKPSSLGNPRGPFQRPSSPLGVRISVQCHKLQWKPAESIESIGNIQRNKITKWLDQQRESQPSFGLSAEVWLSQGLDLLFRGESQQGKSPQALGLQVFFTCFYCLLEGFFWCFPPDVIDMLVWEIC